jgi:hypothetical protein
MKHVNLALNLRPLLAEIFLLFFEKGDLTLGCILAELFD